MSKIGDVEEVSQALKIEPGSVRKAWRTGKFGDYASKDRKGALRFVLPQALEEFRRRTDRSRVAPKPAPAARSAPQPTPTTAPTTTRLMVTWQGPGGTFQLTPQQAAELAFAWEHGEDEPTLTAEMFGWLDRIHDAVYGKGGPTPAQQALLEANAPMTEVQAAYEPAWVAP